MINEVVVPFNGQEVLAVRDQDGKVWISVKRICENIGVDPRSQRIKIQSDSRFRWGDITLPSEGGEQTCICIPLEQLNGWLFTINVNKVREDIRPKLLTYQQECMDVLYKHFMPRGEQDLTVVLEKLTVMDSKLDHLSGINLTVFGDDAPLIKELIEDAAKHHGMSIPEYWGRIRRECDVSSYKLQNRKIINFIRNDLGKGIRLVKEDLE